MTLKSTTHESFSYRSFEPPGKEVDVLRRCATYVKTQRVEENLNAEPPPVQVKDMSMVFTALFVFVIVLGAEGVRIEIFCEHARQVDAVQTVHAKGCSVRGHAVDGGLNGCTHYTEL